LYKIISKKQLSKDVFSADIDAPLIAQSRKPGQFVIICINNEYSERIPLTVAGADPEKGTIRLIWQRVGKTTAELSDLCEGDVIESVTGPLGNPTHIENFGTVVCVGGGIGNAPLLPIAAGLKEAGNYVISILGARNSDLLILADDFEKVSDEVILVTDDGSIGRKALVTEPLKEVCERDKKPDMAFAIGPVPMMKFSSLVTQQYEVPTMVSLNTIMIDGTGMCGGCRVDVGGETKFVCVDGPEFDGHLVDYNMMMKRQNAYKDQETKAYQFYKDHKCKIGLD
jgi:ferredoxin/flavodoxin---NADP+ reductase